jgi:hypothetical protein
VDRPVKGISRPLLKSGGDPALLRPPPHRTWWA